MPFNFSLQIHVQINYSQSISTIFNPYFDWYTIVSKNTSQSKFEARRSVNRTKIQRTSYSAVDKCCSAHFQYIQIANVFVVKKNWTHMPSVSGSHGRQTNRPKSCSVIKFNCKLQIYGYRIAQPITKCVILINRICISIIWNISKILKFFLAY